MKYSLLLLCLQGAVALPNCRDSQHRVGAWVRHNSSTSMLKKSFHCCQVEFSDWQHDPAACYNPSWDPLMSYTDKHLVTGSKDFPTFVGEHSCLCDKQYGRDTVSEREMYYWKPHLCELNPFNASTFCHLLGARRILFVGDSTQAQAFSTLANLVHAGNGSCGGQLHYGRINFLVFSHQHSNGLLDWIRIAGIPEILVMSVGSHLHDVGDMSDIQRRLDPLVGQIRDLYNETHPVSLVWRTIHPGHVECNNHTKPLGDVATIDEKNDKYGWRFFPQFDEMAMNSSKHFGYRVLDMSPLYLRPDAHVGSRYKDDCMHYCTPGPLDLLPQILQQMLFNKEV